ncbi:MAG TPA: phytanoyl-CoA dioxygenase family protein [Miltoncostaeaceae bacterium]|nr:phytanoyl-CoA dioxygenase family protein [Miltoncostaeaceae bacterium]
MTTMTSASTEIGAEQIAQFRREGFLHVPGVLRDDEVRWLRRWCEAQFDLPVPHRLPGNDDHQIQMVFDRHPEVRFMLFQQRTLAVLRALLGGDFVVLPEMSVHRQLFGGWHKDTTSQESMGHRFQWEPDYLMCEVAWYLQDNTDAYAGGLDVEPGSHRRPDPFLDPRHRQPDGSPVGPEWHSVLNRAGDLVVFDFRVNHRATQPDIAPDAIPAENRKFAFFVGVSANTPHVAHYVEYQRSNPTYGSWSRAWGGPFALEASRHGVRLG